MTSYDPKDLPRLRLTYILPTGRHKATIHIATTNDIQSRAGSWASAFALMLPSNGSIVAADYTEANSNEYLPVVIPITAGRGNYQLSQEDVPFEGIQFVGRGVSGGQFRLYAYGLPQAERRQARLTFEQYPGVSEVALFITNNQWIVSVAGSPVILKSYVNQINNSKLRRAARNGL